MALQNRQGGGGGGGAGGAGGNAGCVLVITSAESPIGSGRTPLGTFVSGKTITDGSKKVVMEEVVALQLLETTEVLVLLVLLVETE